MAEKDKHIINRGNCLIFNQKKFQKDRNIEERLGTDKDRDNAAALFEHFGFEVHVYENSTKAQIYSILNKFKDFDHSEYDCFTVIFLSHGHNGLVEAYDDEFDSEDLFLPFTPDRCPTLINKTKMFLIQACRGDGIDPGVKCTAKAQCYVPDGPGSSQSCHGVISKDKIPVDPDFLFCYCTAPEHVSYRNTAKGSIFLQSIVKIFKEKARHLDVLSMMTDVNRDMIKTNDPVRNATIPGMQTACIVSSLRRKIFLSPIKKPFDLPNSNIAKLETNQSHKYQVDAQPPLFSKNVEKCLSVQTTTDELLYKMHPHKRGYCHICIHNEFKKESLDEIGMNQDVKYVIKSFTNLGFDVRNSEISKNNNILKVLKQSQEKNYEEYNCLTMLFLSSGEESFLYDWAKSFYDMFNNKECPSLTSKPKVLFFQAYRKSEPEVKKSEPEVKKSELPKGQILLADCVASSNSDIEIESDGFSHFKIPVHADFLLCFPTTPGDILWGVKPPGSRFIRALVEVFDMEAGESDVLSMITNVNNHINENNHPLPESQQDRAQTAYIISTLKHTLFLKN